MTKGPKGRAAGLGVAILLVAVGVGLLATAGLVSGQPEPTVQIGSGQATVDGGTDVTPLEIVNLASGLVGAATIDVTYDPAIKTPTGCDTSASPFDTTLCNMAFDADTVRVTAISAAGVAGPTIPLADITWTAGSVCGSTPLDVGIVTFSDQTGAPITVLDGDGTNDVIGCPTPTVRIASGQANQGGTDVTRLEALDVDALCAITVEVTYLPSVKDATVCATDPSSLFDGEACNPDFASDTVRFSAISANGVSGATVPLADITWQAVGSAGASTPLTVSVVNYSDCAGAPIVPTPITQNGTNTIATPTATATATATTTTTVTTTATATKTTTATVTLTATATPVPGTETPLPPTGTATGTPVVTVTVTTTPPSTAVPATGTPKATPVAPPPTGGGGLSPLSHLSWTTALAAGAVLAWVLAAAGAFHTLRRRSR